MSRSDLTLLSDDFTQGEVIPTRCTCDGQDRSPHLRWQHCPAAAKSLVLIVDDPDAPHGVFTHWVRFNIPADVDQLDPGSVIGVDGKNDFPTEGYGGPCPPRKHGPHRYFFRLYALDIPGVELPQGAERRAVEEAIDGHVIAQAELMGTFERK